MAKKHGLKPSMDNMMIKMFLQEKGVLTSNPYVLEQWQYFHLMLASPTDYRFDRKRWHTMKTTGQDIPAHEVPATKVPETLLEEAIARRGSYTLKELQPQKVIVDIAATKS